MAHTEEVDEMAELLRQVEDVKLEVAIQSNGPFARHARQKLERLKREIARRRQQDNLASIVALDDDHPDFDHLD